MSEINFKDNIIKNKEFSTNFTSQKLENVNDFNAFNKWKEIHKKTQINKIKEFQAKKESISIFKDDYDEVIKSVEKENGIVKFSLSNLVKSIKYLNLSNAFFKNRISLNILDEILLLIFLYEWVCLKKNKDESILGKQEEAIKKFKIQVHESNSEYKKIFSGIDLDFEDGKQIFKDRLKMFTFKTYEKILNTIKDDKDYFNKLMNDFSVNKYDDSKEYFEKLWKETFEITDEKYSFLYNIKNSDENIICINIETKGEVLAIVKFRIFEIFTYKNGIFSSTNISKELLSMNLIGKKIDMDYFVLMSHVYKLVNRIIKNIFLQELILKNDDSKRIINIKNNLLKNDIYNE